MFKTKKHLYQLIAADERRMEADNKLIMAQRKQIEALEKLVEALKEDIKSLETLNGLLRDYNDAAKLAMRRLEKLEEKE